MTELEPLSVIVKRLGWKFQVGLGVFVLVILITSIYTSISYYWVASAVAFPIGGIVLRFWAFSRKAWFWLTVAILTICHVPLIFVFRDLASSLRALFVFPFGLLDFTL